jgi:hypothetical protein
VLAAPGAEPAGLSPAGSHQHGWRAYSITSSEAAISAIRRSDHIGDTKLLFGKAPSTKSRKARTLALMRRREL